MGRRIKNTFRWRLLVIWIAATVLFSRFRDTTPGGWASRTERERLGAN